MLFFYHCAPLHLALPSNTLLGTLRQEKYPPLASSLPKTEQMQLSQLPLSCHILQPSSNFPSPPLDAPEHQYQSCTRMLRTGHRNGLTEETNHFPQDADYFIVQYPVDHLHHRGILAKPL